MRLESRARRAFIAKGLGLVGVVSMGVALFLIAAPNRAEQLPGLDLSISLDDDILPHGFDFDGDGSDDFLHTFPKGEPNLRGQNPDIPGEVWIRSSLNSPGGGLPDVYYRLVGPRGKDRFGATAAPLGDINLDGRADLIVGAPEETHAAPQNPNANNLLGRAYVYFGRNKVLSNAQASAPRNWQPDLILQSPHPDLDEQFGIRVGRLFDFDGDGIEDIRVRSHVPHRDYPARTYIFSGATGEAITTIIGNNEQALFWDPLPGDANHNLAVDMTDFHIVVRDLGKSGEPGSIAGDVIRDGVVNILDMLAVLDRLGTTIFDTEAMAQAAAGGCSCSSPGCVYCHSNGSGWCCYDAQFALVCGGAGCDSGSTSTTSTGTTSTETTETTETTSTTPTTRTTDTTRTTETTSTSTNTLTTSTLTTNTDNTEPEPPDPLLCDLDIDSDNSPLTSVGFRKHDWLEDTEAKWIVLGDPPAEMYTTPIFSPATHWILEHYYSVEVYFDEALTNRVITEDVYPISTFTNDEMTLWVKGVLIGYGDQVIMITYEDEGDGPAYPPADPCSDTVLFRVVALTPTDIDVDSDNDGVIDDFDDDIEKNSPGKNMVRMSNQSLQEPSEMKVFAELQPEPSYKWRLIFGSNIAITHDAAGTDFVGNNVWNSNSQYLNGQMYLWPLSVGSGSIKLEITEADHTGTLSLGRDTVAYTVIPEPINTLADLDIDSDNDGSTPGLGIHDSIEDSLPGKVIAFNNDDDDNGVGDGILDYLDDDVTGEDDLVPLYMEIDPDNAPYASWQLFSAAGMVKVWSPYDYLGGTTATKVITGQTYYHIPSGHAEVFFFNPFSRIFLVEGIAPGSAPAAFLLMLRVAGQVVNSDSVSATVVEVEIDIIEGLYHEDGQYDLDYTSEDGLGRVYSNRGFSPIDPNSPVWIANRQAVTIDVTVKPDGVVLPAGTEMAWTIEDPDDPSNDENTETHATAGRTLDPNDYDVNGNFDDDNGIDNTGGFDDWEGAPWESVNTDHPLTLNSENVGHTVISNGKSSVRMHVSDHGGDNFRIHVGLSFPNAPLILPGSETGVFTVWKLIDVYYAKMVSATELDFVAANDAMAKAFVELRPVQFPVENEVVNGENQMGANNIAAFAKCEDYVTAADGEFAYEGAPGWFFSAAANWYIKVNTVTPPPPPLYEGPASVILDGLFLQLPFGSTLSDHDQKQDGDMESALPMQGGNRVMKTNLVISEPDMFVDGTVYYDVDPATNTYLKSATIISHTQGQLGDGAEIVYEAGDDAPIGQVRIQKLNVNSVDLFDPDDPSQSITFMYEKLSWVPNLTLFRVMPKSYLEPAIFVDNFNPPPLINSIFTNTVSSPIQRFRSRYIVMRADSGSRDSARGQMVALKAGRLSSPRRVATPTHLFMSLATDSALPIIVDIGTTEATTKKTERHAPCSIIGSSCSRPMGLGPSIRGRKIIGGHIFVKSTSSRYVNTDSKSTRSWGGENQYQEMEQCY